MKTMTEDTFTIRKAAPADLPRIHEIYAAGRIAAAGDVLNRWKMEYRRML